MFVAARAMRKCGPGLFVGMLVNTTSFLLPLVRGKFVKSSSFRNVKFNMSVLPFPQDLASATLHFSSSAAQRVTVCMRPIKNRRTDPSRSLGKGTLVPPMAGRSFSRCSMRETIQGAPQPVDQPRHGRSLSPPACRSVCQGRCVRCVGVPGPP